MFAIENPEALPQHTSSIVVETSKTQAAIFSVNKTFGTCAALDNPDKAIVNTLNPTQSIKNHFGGKKISTTDMASAKLTVLKAPTHGTLDYHAETKSYLYRPELNYLGQDTATLLVEIGSYRITLIYSLRVVQGPSDDDVDSTECPGPTMWEISSSSMPIPVLFNIANLQNGTVAKANGKTITLDTNAAGTDAMAATLKPSERRVWTGVELASVTTRYNQLLVTSTT